MYGHDTAVRVYLDLAFNVFFYILLALAVIFLFGIICQLASINRKMNANMLGNKSASAPENAVPVSSPFLPGQVVVLLKDESQMKIKEINRDGSLVCFKNGVPAGRFLPDEVVDFKEYWAQKNQKQ